MTFASVVKALKGNPVLILDLIKAVLAVLIIFGLPIPAGLDIALAAVVVAALSIVTRSMVRPVRKTKK